MKPAAFKTVGSAIDLKGHLKWPGLPEPPLPQAPCCTKLSLLLGWEGKAPLKGLEPQSKPCRHAFSSCLPSARSVRALRTLPMQFLPSHLASTAMSWGCPFLSLTCQLPVYSAGDVQVHSRVCGQAVGDPSDVGTPGEEGHALVSGPV